MNPAYQFIPAVLDETAQVQWFAHLVDASTPAQVGALLVELVESSSPGVRAVVCWPRPGGGWHCTVDEPLDTDAMELLGAALRAVDGYAQGEGLAAVRLLDYERVALLLYLPEGIAGRTVLDALGPRMALAVRRFYHAVKLIDLHDSHRQLERSEHLQRALFAISDLAGSALDMPKVLEGVHRVISTLMYAENFFIVRADVERGRVRFLYYADELDAAGQLQLEESLEDLYNSATWHVLTHGKPLMGDYAQLLAQTDGTLVTFGPPSADWLGVPMLSDGRVRGALVVQSYGTRHDVYTPEDRSLLEFVANHVLTALERRESKDELEARVEQRTRELAAANAGLQQEVAERQRAERLQATLFQLAQLATADIDEAEFYQRVHALVAALLQADNFFIALLSADQEQLEFPYFVDATGRSVRRRPLGRGMTEYALRMAAPVLLDRQQIEALAQSGEIGGDFGALASSWLALPLWVDEAVIGLVVVQSYDPSFTYTAADQELLSFVAMQIANSIFRRRATIELHKANAQLEQRVEARTGQLREQIARREEIQRELKHQLMHDQLTGLPNRSNLRAHLDQALAAAQHPSAHHCALLYLDVDRFKIVNDSLGHLAGDTVLKEVASRLLTCVREPDIVARLSGDEFAILLDHVDTAEAATQVASRVLEAINVPLRVAGEDLSPSASIGIALGDHTYTAADELLRDADVALYRAKHHGRNRYAMFDISLAREAVDVLGMAGALRHALHNREFEPYLQPLVRLADGAVVGYEALLRWHHPQRGLLLPHQFLNVAEDSGLIEAIDWHMFELSCRAMASHDFGAATLSINVSALHLGRADFPVRLLGLLERTRFPPQRLVVEITEGALLGDPEQVRRMLHDLRKQGIGAALDDFGTGYSSLSYLHSLPLTLLKIDRSFVQALSEGDHHNSTTVVAAIVALARALDMQVIAEGIETDAEHDTLLTMGCALGQGFALGRPQPAPYWLAHAADHQRSAS